MSVEKTASQTRDPKPQTFPQSHIPESLAPKPFSGPGVMSGVFSFIDPTVTAGNIIEIASIISGGLLVLIKMNNTVIALRHEVSEMQTEIRKIGEVLTKLAVTENRLANIEQDIRELRHTA